MSYHSTDEIICENCQHKNEPTAVHCFKCGARLVAPDTLPISPDEIPDDKLMDMQYGMRTIEHSRLYSGALFLTVLEHAEAIIVIDKHDIVLGRDDPGAKPTRGNLSRFNAYGLGVSRNHAQITYEDGQYILTDLGSANGTWINRDRLLPHETRVLQHDDRVWLGKLVLVVYLANG